MLDEVKYSFKRALTKKYSNFNKINMKFSILVTSVLMVLFAGCETTVTTSQGPSANTTIDNGLVYSYRGEYNSEAVSQLVPFLMNMGIPATRVGEDHLRLTYGDDTFFLFPKTTTDGLDRLMLYQYWSVKEDSKENMELILLINKLNSELNIGAIVISEDWSLIEHQTSITFVNELSQTELVKSLE